MMFVALILWTESEDFSSQGMSFVLAQWNGHWGVFCACAMNGGRAHHDMVSKSNGSHYSLPHSTTTSHRKSRLDGKLLDAFSMGPVRVIVAHDFGWQSSHSVDLRVGWQAKWLPLKFGYHDVMRTSPISRMAAMDSQ